MRPRCAPAGLKRGQRGEGRGGVTRKRTTAPGWSVIDTLSFECLGLWPGAHFLCPWTLARLGERSR